MSAGPSSCSSSPASAMPAAWAIRPQFGIAAEERRLDQRRVGDRAGDPLRLLARSAAPRASTRPTRVAPSPSATISSASCSSTASSRPSGSGSPARAARLEQDGVVGRHLPVDRDPLEGGVDRRAAGRPAASSTTASVCTKQSMVAKPGSIIPAPFAWAESVTPPARTQQRFGPRSVVMIASEKSPPPTRRGPPPLGRSRRGRDRCRAARRSCRSRRRRPRSARRRAPAAQRSCIATASR